MKYPTYVELCEVGPRDGFQFESKLIPTDRKVNAIKELIAAGLPRVQITSFVHPGKVPQMADAEKVVQAVGLGHSSVLSGLALNVRGVHRAAESGLRAVDLSIATNRVHGLDNANMSVEEGRDQTNEMIDVAHANGMSVQLNLQTVWGYQSPGDTSLDAVVALADHFSERGLESFSLADSTGMANPESIRRVVSAVQKVTAVPLVLHLHDTRGLALANIVSALEMGVTRFDTSMGGLGGCPFIPGATGNVATEDVIYLLEELGIKTGVESRRVAAISREMAAFLGRPLSGKMYKLLG
ncbi:MAG: hydroxymethylglutaryl-CoA lyase [Bacteroidetes bacterium]|nr:hydroxymethylglutaryl-CoA lyase [Bacteroidota bacterium]